MTASEGPADGEGSDDCVEPVCNEGVTGIMVAVGVEELDRMRKLKANTKANRACGIVRDRCVN